MAMGMRAHQLQVCQVCALKHWSGYAACSMTMIEHTSRHVKGSHQLQVLQGTALYVWNASYNKDVTEGWDEQVRYEFSTQSSVLSAQCSPASKTTTAAGTLINTVDCSIPDADASHKHSPTCAVQGANTRQTAGWSTSVSMTVHEGECEYTARMADAQTTSGCRNMVCIYVSNWHGISGRV